MGVLSSPGTEQPHGRRRTIRRTFVAMVAAPVACLVVLWGLVLGAVIAGAFGGPDTPHHDHEVVVGFVAVTGIGLAIIIAAVVMMGLFARRLAQDITDLESTARRLAEEEMPGLVERLRRGEQGVVPEEIMQQPRTKTAEVARADAAMASLQHTAAVAAAGEAGLRNGIGQVFVSLARRNQSLLQRQLRLIDALEQKASDPATLADLFPLDHLTTRMRRHAEGLIILSGAAPGRSWSEPVPVIDVIRGAVAEVEDYKRVTVLTMADDAVAGLAAADMIHLLAELIENATLSSPSGTRVEVRAERVANGFAIEIDDRGLGIEAGQLQTINQQLAEPPDFDLANADQLGLFVVGKLAARHGVRVALRPSPYGGTTAVALMPNSIVVPINATEADTDPGLRPVGGRMPGLDLHHADALALTGRHSAQPSPSGDAGEAERAGGGPSLAPGLDAPAGPADAGLASTGTGPGTAGPGPGTIGTGLADTGSGLGSTGAGLGSTGAGLGSTGRGLGSTSAGLGSIGADLGSPGPGHGSAAPGFRPAGAGPGSSGAAPFQRGLARPPTLPGQDAPGPASGEGDDPELAPEPRTAGTYRGLPRRVRQASLNPHLKGIPGAPRGRDADSAPPAAGRSPEEARSLVASMQSGWQRGRDDDSDGESAAAQTARRQDSEAPQGEETLWTSRPQRPGPDSN
jgi:signal transduction histidine kinase